MLAPSFSEANEACEICPWTRLSVFWHVRTGRPANSSVGRLDSLSGFLPSCQRLSQSPKGMAGQQRAEPFEVAPACRSVAADARVPVSVRASVRGE